MIRCEITHKNSRRTTRNSENRFSPCASFQESANCYARSPDAQPSFHRDHTFPPPRSAASGSHFEHTCLRGQPLNDKFEIAFVAAGPRERGWTITFPSRQFKGVRPIIFAFRRFHSHLFPARATWSRRRLIRSCSGSGERLTWLIA